MGMGMADPGGSHGGLLEAASLVMTDLLSRGPAMSTLLQVVGVSTQRLERMRAASEQGTYIERALVAALRVLDRGFRCDATFLDASLHGNARRTGGSGLDPETEDPSFDMDIYGHLTRSSNPLFTRGMMGGALGRGPSGRSAEPPMTTTTTTTSGLRAGMSGMSMSSGLDRPRPFFHPLEHALMLESKRLVRLIQIVGYVFEPELQRAGLAVTRYLVRRLPLLVPTLLADNNRVDSIMYGFARCLESALLERLQRAAAMDMTDDDHDAMPSRSHDIDFDEDDDDDEEEVGSKGGGEDRDLEGDRRGRGRGSSRGRGRSGGRSSSLSSHGRDDDEDDEDRAVMVMDILQSASEQPSPNFAHLLLGYSVKMSVDVGLGMLTNSKPHPVTHTHTHT